MSKPRIPLEAEKVYHIWTHANGSENLFREDENYRYFLEKYTYYIHPVADTFAYCLMPNHLHLMIRIRKEEELLALPGFETLEGLEISKKISQKFSHLFNGYTQGYNKKYDRKGSLFIDSFRRKLIDSGQYFTQLIAYIHYNPVHHAFVKNPGDWTFSSWHTYLFNKTTKINKKEALSWFGSKKAFKKIHENLNPQNLISVFEG